jgi:hypothetical protein
MADRKSRFGAVRAVLTRNGLENWRTRMAFDLSLIEVWICLCSIRYLGLSSGTEIQGRGKGRARSKRCDTNIALSGGGVAYYRYRLLRVRVIMENTNSQDDPPVNDLQVDNARREAIRRLGKFAAYTAPAMLAMLASETKAQGASGA